MSTKIVLTFDLHKIAVTIAAQFGILEGANVPVYGKFISNMGLSCVRYSDVAYVDNMVDVLTDVFGQRFTMLGTPRQNNVCTFRYNT